jgi:hypothetical protein
MPRFAERPAESRGRGAGRGTGAAGTAADTSATIDQEVLSQVRTAVRAARRRTGGGAEDGAESAYVPTGTYQVVVTIDGQSTRVPLRVERVGSAGGAGPAIGGGDDGGSEP